MEVKIQIATLQHLKEIRDLNKKLCEKEHNEFDKTVRSDFPFMKSGKEYFRKRIKEKFVFVALIENKVIGYIAGGINPSENYRTLKKIAEAENMFVVEKYRSLGVGKKLFDEFIKLCKTKKAERIRVVASAQNIRAINFYRREKFKDYNLVLEREI